MPYARDHKPRTRQRILDAAAALFSAQGFEGTTIEHVMQACGLTRGGFYSHFASKADLYAEALGPDLRRGLQRDLQSGLQTAPVGGDGSRSRVDRLLAACADAPDAERGSPTPRWLFLATDAASRRPEVRAAYARTFEALAEQLRHEAAEAAEDGDSGQRAALAAAALVVGTLAVAATIDDAALRQRLVRASRTAARTLTRPAPRRPDPAPQPDYLWAVDDRIAAAARRLHSMH